jgi:hypothetical protein
VKGQKAIALCMPVTFKKKDSVNDDDLISTFIIKNGWFSVDQTEGADYVAEVVIPEWDAKKAMAELNITEIKFDMISGNCQGFARENSISINPVAALPHKTRFHEMAHVVLGHTKEGTLTDSEFTPVDIREVEAESVAYILCSVLGLNGLMESRGYIQNWLKGNQIADKSAQKIFSCANKILKAGQ